MKIQSRPPVSNAPVFDKDEILCFIRNILEIDGYNTNSTYRKVLATGAASMLCQMGVITDYQAFESSIGCGYYNIVVDVRFPNGEYVCLHV